MRKVQWAALLGTLALAIPFTVVAILATAYLTSHLTTLVAATVTFSQHTTAGGRGWIQEMAERLPEVAGMGIGLSVLLTIFLFARQGETRKA